MENMHFINMFNIIAMRIWWLSHSVRLDACARALSDIASELPADELHGDFSGDCIFAYLYLFIKHSQIVMNRCTNFVPALFQYSSFHFLYHLLFVQ